LFDPASFLRVLVFGIIFAGIEYRYVNRREKDWTQPSHGFLEKPAFWVITPYHAYFLLPLFIVSAFTLPITAWAGNTFVLAVIEDVAYFVWRGRGVAKGEWTTTLFGSFSIGQAVIPTWWPLDTLIAAALFLVPL
jgi:hypothetical protein